MGENPSVKSDLTGSGESQAPSAASQPARVDSDRGDSSTPPRIPDHELLQCIGRGAYGEVWLARSVLGGYRAVKVVYRRNFSESYPFEREFHGIQKFEPVSRTHEGLIDILHAGRNEAEGCFHYVMELGDNAGDEHGTTSESGASVEMDSNPTAAAHPPKSYVPRSLRHELKTRGRLPPEECLRIALTLSSALAHLHAQNLVHRDIKPSNILFVKGTPKLADIGLVADADEARSFVGTVGFIPPEGPGTPQADIYSLGKVLYEMVTGRDRQEFPALPEAFRADADPLLVELNGIILRACESDLRRRYPSAQGLRDDLERLAAGRSATRSHAWRGRFRLAGRWGIALVGIAGLIAAGWLGSQYLARLRSGSASQDSVPSGAVTASIAVLPFDNLSTGGADDYLGDQLASELGAMLMRIPQLRVMARHTTLVLKSARNPDAEAQRLKLDALLHGRLRRTGDRLWLELQLVNPADSALLWTQVYDRPMAELYGIQADAAEQLIRALRLQLSELNRVQLAPRATRNLAAYQAFLEGMHSMLQETPTGCSNAIRRGEEAVRLDPAYAQAYALLAFTYMVMNITELGPPTAWERATREAAERAVQLDSALSDAHLVRGFVKAAYDWDWPGAEAEYRRALALNSNSIYALDTLHAFLTIQERHAEAAAVLERMLKLDPVLSSMQAYMRALGSGNSTLAIENIEKVHQYMPGWAEGYRMTGWLEDQRGRTNEAARSYRQYFRMRNASDTELAALDEAFRTGGIPALLHLRLAQMERSPHYFNWYVRAMFHARLGDREDTLRCLEQSAANREFYANQLANKVFDFVRAEPRFQALKRQMKMK